MLGRLLLTFLVIVVAVIVIRHQRSQPGPTSVAKASESAKDPAGSDLRTAAYMFLVLMLGTGAALYYLRWQDDHEVINVILHRGANETPTSYQVYKYQLQQRSFVTTEGVQITLADNERMEVTGLE